MRKIDWDSIPLQEISDFLEDVREYGSDQTASANKAKSALNTLYASDYGYDEWKNIGISFKAAGGELNDWLSWCSIDAQGYDEKLARGIFENVSVDGDITEKTLYKHAWNAGWQWSERYKDKLPEVKHVPKRREFDSPEEQAITQLEAMFKPDDKVNIVTKATLNKKGKLVPSGYGTTYTCSDLCESIRENGLEAAIGGYDHAAGVWLRCNPMDGSGISDANVMKYRNALVESDDMPLKDQERMLFELGLPISCVTNSGGKSLHAIVRIEADGPEHFADRVQELHETCERNGMSIDKANRNPSRLTRLAGIKRGENEQKLLHLSIGAADFRTWKKQERSSRVAFDYGIEPMDMETPIVNAEEVVEGIIRRGDKACVAGASKSYKSFSLIQLAISTCTGGRWFGWKCKQGRVLYINCELRGESFRQRVWDVAEAMGANPREIGENMDVWNMRGRTQPLETSKDHIIEQAAEFGYDVVILDPIYKLFSGDENSAQDVSAFMLLMDELADRLQSAVVYCHHHSKGAKGDVSAQDRFSGSGVFARDCDALIDISPLDIKNHTMDEFGWDRYATPWRIETVLRDFAPQPPIDIVFDYPLHHIDADGNLMEFKVTSAQSKGGSKRGEQQTEAMNANVKKLESWVSDYYKNNGTLLKTAHISPIFDASEKTIRKWVGISKKLKFRKEGRESFIILEND